jgi:hypothetical protein
MVRDKPMVSLAKMMLMNSSFQKTNVPEQLKLPCLKIKKLVLKLQNLNFQLFFRLTLQGSSFLQNFHKISKKNSPKLDYKFGKNAKNKTT